MLPGELKRRACSAVPVRIGAPIAVSNGYATFQSDEALAAHLRVTTYLLSCRPNIERAVEAAAAAAARAPTRTFRRSGGYRGRGRAPAHVSAGSSTAGDHAVYCARRPMRVPHLLEEIGRLREQTFRAVGEGTGRARDLDSFDEHYEHLFLWNARREEVVGAYRVGRIDEICERRAGRRGLYTASLFHYREPFFPLLGPGAGARPLLRARPRQQRSFAPLLYAVEGHRRVRGAPPALRSSCSVAVSISSDYDESVAAAAGGVHAQPLPAIRCWRNSCRPAHPVPRGRHGAVARRGSGDALGHLDALGALVEDIEPDRQGRADPAAAVSQARRANARPSTLIPAFNDSIDCLLMVDSAPDRSARAAKISS